MKDMEKKKYISEIPELMKEWDWEANADLDPTKITCGSGKKAWWKCSKGHEWLAIRKFGGSVQKDMNGNHIFLIDVKGINVQFVQIKKYKLALMI